MDKDIAISIKNVKKSFRLPHYRSDSLKEKITQVFKKKDKGADTYEALKGLSFDIKKGEFIGILGRNGAGKSTLLKIIAEIYKPTSGHIKVHGKLVPFIELGVGFNKELTGRENVYLNGALLGFSKSEVDAMYESIVDFAELNDYMDQKLKNYSSGMKVRLAFSVAIKADADILLLDEVLAVGDAAFQKKCYEYFDSLKENKKTIVFVTHNMSAVRQYCDRAVLIEEGKVSCDGYADEVATRYLELFNKEKVQKSTTSGANKLDIKSVKAEATDEAVAIDVRLENKTNEKIEGFGVFCDIHRSGSLVCGVGCGMGLKEDPLEIAANSSLMLTFRMENVFGAGRYSIVVDAINRDGERFYYDYRKDAAEFVILDGRVDDKDYFPIVLPADVQVKQVSAGHGKKRK
jgi:ABC-type polysaccharide/polyol phosphate transport system, ATPase component